MAEEIVGKICMAGMGVGAKVGILSAGHSILHVTSELALVQLCMPSSCKYWAKCIDGWGSYGHEGARS